MSAAYRCRNRHRLLSYPPAEQQVNHDEFDYPATNVVIPHPMYASQRLGSDTQPVRPYESAGPAAPGRCAALPTRRHVRRRTHSRIVT